MRLARALITGSGSMALPTPKVVARLVPRSRGGRRCVGAGEHVPGGGIVALGNKVFARIGDGSRTGGRRLQPGEDLLAFLDDRYIFCPAERAFRALREALAAHARIDVHLGKTKAC